MIVTRKFRILLVDDDYDDRCLIVSAIQEGGMEIDLFEAASGYDAIDYLLGQSPYGDRGKFPFPDLVLLDLKMPGIDDFALLKHVRADASLKNLPVFILSNSTMESDVKMAYGLGVNGCYQKPSRYQDLVALLQSVLLPWHNVYSGLRQRTSPES